MARGWHAVLLARRENRLRALAEELGAEASLAMPPKRTRGPGPRVRVEYEVCDVGRREDVERVAGAVIERHPLIALLVNNAGIPGRAGFTAIDPERLEQVLRVNYLGGVWCLRAFLPALEAAVVETEGFPQATTLRNPLLRRVVVGPDHVARHVLKTIERDRRETFVPRWYRLAAVAQALAPGLVARFSARSRCQPANRA